MVSLEFLESRVQQTKVNFNFEFKEGFKSFGKLIFDNIKHMTEDELNTKFQQLWLTSSEKWNKDYGYRGHPNLSDWIYLLSGKRPLTDYEKKEAKKRHNLMLSSLVSRINSWVSNERNIEWSFKNQYNNPNRQFEKNIINSALGIKRELTEDEIVRMGRYIREQFCKEGIDFNKDFKKQCSGNFATLLKECASKESPLRLI